MGDGGTIAIACGRSRRRCCFSPIEEAGSTDGGFCVRRYGEAHATLTVRPVLAPLGESAAIAAWLLSFVLRQSDEVAGECPDLVDAGVH
jgi:hypothetical protein